jgi:nitric oxide synthase oxygenase domain/subunit
VRRSTTARDRHLTTTRDITRARTRLGWEPKRSLRGTIPVMIAALKADPIKWYEESDLEPPGWLKEQAARQDAGGAR